MRLLRPRIAALIALSASSPFWRGFPTGLCSTRHSVFATFPRSGTPPAFGDYGEFAAYVQALERARVLDDYTRIWWDLRPHPRLGTVEVRAMDAVERVEDAIALAAYVQALVKRAGEAPAPPPQSALEDALVRENKWQAIRYGLDATVIDANATAIPMRDHILSTLDDLAQTSALDSKVIRLLDIERIVRAGTGADRQLATFADSRTYGQSRNRLPGKPRRSQPALADAALLLHPSQPRGLLDAVARVRTEARFRASGTTSTSLQSCARSCLAVVALAVSGTVMFAASLVTTDSPVEAPRWRRAQRRLHGRLPAIRRERSPRSPDDRVLVRPSFSEKALADEPAR